MRRNPSNRLPFKKSGYSVALLGLLMFTAALAFGATQDIVGHYVGTWTNLTFSSTGKAVIDIKLSGTNATAVFDMDGFVFGQFDPPLITMPATVQGDLIQIDSHGVGLFGDIKGSIDSGLGTFTATLTNIPGGFIQQVTASGTISNGVIRLDYTVIFPGSPGPTNPARGVMSVVRVLSITRAAVQDGNFILEWAGGTGPYQVSRSPSLAVGSWSNVGPPTANTTLSIPIEPGSSFFRVAGQ